MFWLILCVLIVGVSNGQVVVCPLSSVMDLNGTYNYFYPMDIYGTMDQYVRANQSNELYRCDADEILAQRMPHYCSSKMERFCPMHSQNVKDATAHKYHRSSSLCHLKAKLADKMQKINVFALGGSVTCGTGADNCHKDDPAPEAYFYSTNHRCAWPYHFGEWLRQTSVAEVKLYNLGLGGHTSYTRSLSFPDELASQHNIVQFTENDIIFIDHSANDEPLRQQPLMEKALEHLIRRVYSMSGPRSWPSIVVLDANPYKITSKEWLYPAAYDKIVRYYNLSMWSYREAVHSNYSRTHQANISQYLLWNRNFERDFHPTWHLQLFMADLYAAIFQTELNHCTPQMTDMALRLHRSPVPLTSTPALTLSSSENECDASSRPYLSASYREHVNGIPFIGTYTRKPANGSSNSGSSGSSSSSSWQLREDRPGKGGFIEELPEGVYPSQDKSASIIFRLANTTEEILKDGNGMPHLQLVFLRTYENAGMVDVYLCDEPLGTLDALWTKPDTTRISVPEYYIEGLQIQRYCGNYTYPYITVTHVNSGKEVNRGRWKFKLIGLKVCKTVHAA